MLARAPQGCGMRFDQCIKSRQIAGVDAGAFSDGEFSGGIALANTAVAAVFDGFAEIVEQVSRKAAVALGIVEHAVDALDFHLFVLLKVGCHAFGQCVDVGRFV